MSDGNATPTNNADTGSASGSASPAKKDVPATPKFTEKEDHLLKIAWLCLKSGPPEIDIVKLTDLGGFNTQKTAANTWGTIKKKLLTMAPASTDEDGAATPKPKATPKKRATPAKAKKAAADGADGDGDDEDTGSPKKKARATPKKGKASPKKKVKAEEDAEEDAGEDGVKEEMEA